MRRIQTLLALILTLTFSITLWAGLFTVPSAFAAPQADLTRPQPASTLLPTPSFEEQPVVYGRPPLSLTLALLGFCCIFLVIIGVLILGVVVRNQNTKEGSNVEQ